MGEDSTCASGNREEIGSGSGSESSGCGMGGMGKRFAIQTVIIVVGGETSYTKKEEKEEGKKVNKQEKKRINISYICKVSHAATLTDVGFGILWIPQYKMQECEIIRM